MNYTYPITIHHLYSSPGHNYFTHSLEAPGHYPTVDSETIVIHAGQGIVGDRFYGKGATFDGHVTFFAWEIYQLLRQEFGLVSPAALRRNVVVEGVPLNQLIGQPFAINSVEFYGTKHCAPCRWMDVAVAAGGLPFLKGRGGLRAQVLTSGELHRGPAQLTTTVALDCSQITARLMRPKLP